MVDVPSKAGPPRQDPLSTRELVGQLLQFVPLVLILPLLQWAAKHDRHFHRKVNGFDSIVREGAGLFLVAGLVAIVPAIAAVVVLRQRRWAVVISVVCLLMAAACEFVVSVAPSPWFSF